MSIIFTILLFFSVSQIYLPFNSADRHDISKIHLTSIGQFGLMRKPRPGVPAHFHTGIDIMRPGKNYNSEPVFPVTAGKVISKRTDGPYANIIIEHDYDGTKIWTLYEHVAGINVKAGDIVSPFTKIARFMNKEELKKYGRQFDHFHLEVIKIKPKAIKPDNKNPERFFESYTLVCYEKSDLEKYYYEPIDFLKRRMKKAGIENRRATR